MQTPSLKTLLSSMIDLTNERDMGSLENLLIEVLGELIASVLKKSPKQLLICKPQKPSTKNPTASTFSVNAIAKTDTQAPKLDAEMTALLTECFTRGEILYCSNDCSVTHLYPLRNSKQETLAIVLLTMDTYNEHLHEVIMLMLKIYKNFTALIIDNERDMLTGLRNRKTFEISIEKVLSKIRNHGQRIEDASCKEYFFAIFDIDHFKHVNDQFGHIMGDEVLILFSNLLTEVFRDGDMLFRFGGEEFVGVFECASLEKMQFVLNRMRQKTENFAFPRVGNITVSAGFTEINSNDTSSQVLDRADAALYYAKNHGRNQVAFYEELLASNLICCVEKNSEIDFF